MRRKYLKYGRWAALFIFLDIFTGVAVGFLLMTTVPVLEQKVPHPVPETSQVPMVIPDHCWTKGKGHPYPNQVLYDGELHGAKMTEDALDAIFGENKGDLDPLKISAFCYKE